MSNTEELLEAYIKQLSDKEKIVYKIARDHLGSSFDLSLSIGFLEWQKTYKPLKKK